MSQDMVNHPSHYNQFKREVIDEMRLIFGDEAVKIFCKLNAYKYIRRADFKGQKEQDLAKAEWYMDEIEKINHECRASSPMYAGDIMLNVCESAKISSAGLPEAHTVMY